jgi:DNA-directed RNA polymerase, mitochondrial
MEMAASDEDDADAEPPTELAEDVDADVKPMKKVRKKRAKNGETLPNLPRHVLEIVDGTSPEADNKKFIDLVDLLPPLPKKGTFDVKTIKNSLYFFS